MFKGYQRDFPDKPFCKLNRRRKCKNKQSAITLPCLPVFFTHITCAQVGNKCGLTSALIGQKSALELPPNSGGGASAFITNLGIILPINWQAVQTCTGLQICKQWEADPFPTFHDFSSGNLCKFSLLGEHPQSLLNATCGVGYAFILNTFIYWLLRNLHRSSISHKRKMKM